MSGVIQEIQFAMDQAAIERLIAESTRAGDRAGKAMTDAIGDGGKDRARTVAVDMMATLSRELERNESRVKEALARGLISPEAASRAAAANAQAYNAGILRAMDQLRAKGALTNEAFINMTKELKNVGAASSEVDKTTGAFGKMQGFLLKIGGMLGGIFALGRIKMFGQQSIEEWKQDEAALARLDSALRRVGTSTEALSIPIRALEGDMRSLRLDEDETQEILGTLIGRTNQVAESFKNVNLVVALARREHMDFASASQIVANLMNGNVMRIRMLGINATNAKDALAELRRETMGEGERWAATLEGRLRGLNVLWLNFKSAVGQAMIEAGGGSSVIDTLSATIQTMTTWVMDNHEAIVGMKDAIFEVIGAMGDFIGSLNFSKEGFRSFRKDLADIEHALNQTSAAVTWFSGSVKTAWGDLVQMLSFGLLGKGISEEGRRIMAEGNRMLEQANSEWRATLNRINPSTQKVTPGEGESLGTLHGGGTGVIPVGGSEGGKDALKDAAEAKRVAAEIKRVHDELITNATKLIESDAGREAGLFVLRGEEAQLKKQLDDTNLSVEKRIALMLQLADVQKSIKGARPGVDLAPWEAGADKVLGINQPKGAPGAPSLTPEQIADIQGSFEPPDLSKIPASMPSIGTTFDSILGDMRENSEDVAGSIADNFSEAFDRMKEDGFTVNSILSNLGKGMAKSILGEIAKVAKGEAMQALANAIKFTAIGLGQAATGNPLASKSFAAAAVHAKSAAAWGLLAGAMGSMGGGGGGSSGGGGGASADRTSSADSMNKAQNVTHIYLDGVDPTNPKHQELIGDTQRRYHETTGDQIVYHPAGAR